MTQIRKMVPPDVFPGVNDFVKSEKGVMAQLVRPIEMAVHRFSVELLRGMQSVMVGSHDAEVERLRAAVTRAAQAVEASGDAKAMEVLRTQLSKLQGLEDIASSAEGVVFQFKGNAYKFTGAFAPVNQILGLLKYGRGGSKVRADEGYLREVVGRLRQGPQQKVRMRLGELRVLLGRQLLVEVAVPGLQAWPSDSLTIPETSEADLVNKIGPFEQRLATVLGGQVVGGGSKSYDLEVNGSKYEVKKPNKAAVIRLGTEGAAVFAKARGNFEEVCRLLTELFTNDQSRAVSVRELLLDILGQETYDDIVRFVTSDIPSIMKGNFSDGRMKKFYDVIQALSAAQGSAGDDEFMLMMGNNEHSIERDIDITTYLKIGHMLDVPDDELNVTQSDMLNTALDAPVFRDPKAFMRDNWTNGAPASEAFKHVDYVAFVAESGYRVVPVSDIDSVLRFNDVAAGRVEYRVVA